MVNGGARDFHKVMFNLPIPVFDPSVSLHKNIAATAVEAERIAQSLALSENLNFVRARKLVRDALTETGISQQIDDLVARLLDQSPGEDGADDE